VLMDDWSNLPSPSLTRDGGDAPEGDLVRARHPSPSPQALASVGPLPRPRRPGRPWGFWATIGWTCVWLIVFVGFTTVLCGIAMVVMIATGMASDLPDAAHAVSTSGLVLGLAAIAQVPVLVGLAVLLAWVRMPVTEYLGLRWATRRQTLVGLLILLALIAAQDLFTWAIGRPIVSDLMVNWYESAGFLPVLVLALVVAAPVVEEVFFRGFMFKGLAASKVGAAGAILLTTFLWAGIHLQYDWYGKLLIFTMGLFLGAVRWWTGSVTLTILLHGMMNAVATTQIIVVAEGWA